MDRYCCWCCDLIDAGSVLGLVQYSTAAFELLLARCYPSFQMLLTYLCPRSHNTLGHSHPVGAGFQMFPTYLDWGCSACSRQLAYMSILSPPLAKLKFCCCCCAPNPNCPS